MYDKKVLSKSVALHLIHAKKIQNCRSLSWLISGKLSQVELHHKG